jgi:hypothetical protein
MGSEKEIERAIKSALAEQEKRAALSDSEKERLLEDEAEIESMAFSVYKQIARFGG